LGIEIRTGVLVGDTITLSDLRNEYDAVFVGAGAGLGKSMRIPGEELNGVFQGVDFLKRFTLGESLDLGKNVVVVGGGNTAVDSLISIGESPSLDKYPIPSYPESKNLILVTAHRRENHGKPLQQICDALLPSYN